MRLALLALVLVAIAGPAAREARAAAPDTTARVRVLLRWARDGLALGTVESRQIAIRDLEEALALQPTNPQLWIERGRAYEIGGFETEARACFVRAATLTPRDPEPWQRLGMAWKREWLRWLDPAALDSATANLRRVVALRPYDARTWVRLVPLFYEHGDLRGASAAAARALAARPQYPEAQLADAYLAYRRGEVEHADSAFARALPRLPADERARFDDLAPLAGAADAARLAARPDSLRRFWASLDPDPTTRENEVRLEYWSRVAHVLFLFEDPLHPALDARADTYLRYGPPRSALVNPPGTRRFFIYGALHTVPGGLQRGGAEYPLDAEVWSYPDLGMRVTLQDRSLTGRYEPAATRGFDPLSAPDPRVLARRHDLLALDGGAAVFPTLPPAALRIEVRGTLLRFEGARGPRLLAQVQAPGGPGDTLVARWVVRDSTGREVARDEGALALSACDPGELRLADFSTALPPGSYDVAVSVRDPHHRRGLFRAPAALAAPTSSLALSDVVLSCGAPSVLAGGGAIRVESAPGARVAHGAPLVVYFEIYRLATDAAGLARFEYEYTVRRVSESADGRRKAAIAASLASTSATRVETQVGALRRQFVTVPAEALGPGDYRLEIVVHDLTTDARAERTVEFTME